MNFDVAPSASHARERYFAASFHKIDLIFFLNSESYSKHDKPRVLKICHASNVIELYITKNHAVHDFREVARRGTTSDVAFRITK